MYSFHCLCFFVVWIKMRGGADAPPLCLGIYLVLLKLSCYHFSVDDGAIEVNTGG